MDTGDTLVMHGKPVAEALYSSLEPRISRLQTQNIVPALSVVLVGEDPASKVYVGSKTRAFKRQNLITDTANFPASISTGELVAEIDRLNSDPQVHGILVQLPLPAGVDSNRVLTSVSPLKDVDGFHPANLGLLLTGRPRFIPCTPHGILAILEHYQVPVAGRHAVIVGRSNIVGKPMMALLANKWERGNATVTICHTGTPDIARHTRQADLLVVASGRPNLITAGMVKAGVDIVDVGMNRVPDDSEKGYHLAGDVATGEMLGHANSITPVPGGVGPMTVAMLVHNTVTAAEISAGNTGLS